MAISFRKYVDILSGVGAGAVVAVRDLILRLFTTNLLVPTSTLIEFESAAEVGDYFGLESPEYLRALFYFGWISKSITSPKKLAFARWVDEAAAPRIYGSTATQSLTAWQGITDGTFDLTIGATTNTIGPIDFSAAASLAAVAALIEDAIQAETGTMWTAATVAWEPTRGSFNFVGGQAVAAAISAEAASSGTNILATGLLGWNSLAIFSDGAVAETPQASVNASAVASTNFGSFAFIDTLALNEHTEIAAWNQTQNNLYQYLIKLADAGDAQDYRDALINYSGVGVTYSPLATEYPELIPAMILAATDYERANSTKNYMYQQFAVTPSVGTDALSDLLDGLRINYYGVTQTAGQQLAFYQRALLMGQASAPIDMNVYANEQWLKDANGAALMELFLNLETLPANLEGRGLILAAIQQNIDKAISNGTILQEKTLTLIQKLYIAQVTNDQEAWRQVQGIGYWVDCIISPQVIDGRTEYIAEYTLVYSKGDAVRKIEGRHILI
jgi:hypothetical protein